MEKFDLNWCEAIYNLYLFHLVSIFVFDIKVFDNKLGAPNPTRVLLFEKFPEFWISPKDFG